jgi:hypothetical protein
MARRRPRYWVPLVTTLIVFALSVPLALAINAASALGRWPGWLDIVRRHPVRSVAVLAVASLVVLAVAVIWDRRSPETASTDDLLDVEGRLHQRFDEAELLAPESMIGYTGYLPIRVRCFSSAVKIAPRSGEWSLRLPRTVLVRASWRGSGPRRLRRSWMSCR